MELPLGILAGLNRDLSRHKSPETLDWNLVRNKWVADEGDRRYVIMFCTGLGYLIGETKKVALGASMGLVE